MILSLVSDAALPGATWCQESIHHTLHSHWFFYIGASCHQVKWSCSCTIQNHMWCSGFILWNWDGRHIIGCPGSSPHAQHFGGIGTLSICSWDPHRDWQLYCPWHPCSPSSHEAFFFDMCYHWIKDRIAQGQFNLFWASGKQKREDYFTKHHPLAHHLLMCPLNLHTANHVSHMWGCDMYTTHCWPWLHVITRSGIFSPVKTEPI